MHLHKRVWGNVLASIALVTFALASAAPLATPVGAQTQQTSSTAGVGSAFPAEAFNPLGTNHTVTFACTAAGVTGVAATAGCFNVSASLQDIVTGSAANVNSGTCGASGALQVAGTTTCFGTPANPLTNAAATGAGASSCPSGTVLSGVTVNSTYNPATNRCEEAIGATTTTAAPFTITATDCATAGGTVNAAGTVCQFAPPASSQATATINPGANHAYQLTFTGYTAVAGTTATAVCPQGTTPVTTIPGFAAPAGTVFCPFSITVAKKYFEVTTITLTPATGSCAGGTLTYAEGLKSYFGPSCVVTAAVSGTVILKTGVNCSNGSEPANGSAAPAPFPANSTYQCVGDTLSVTGITPTGPVPVTISVSGPGSAICTTALGGLSAGAVGGTSVSTTTGVATTICPTGAGAVVIKACLAASPGASLPNNQPAVCSSTVTVQYTVVAARVVPYVRWAGEKIVLTKCFGIGLAGSTVEFALKGNQDSLSATLLPTDLGTLAPSTAGGATLANGATQVFTTADATGCASVIGYADGEGVMNVDAAVYSAGGTSPLINEHAFQVFYLKFNNVTLEDFSASTMPTYTVAQALSPYLGFLSAAAPAVTCAAHYLSPLCAATAGSLTPSSFSLPPAPGTGASGMETVPICATQYVRAMVHGYFEFPGDPSGRPASTVAIPGAATGSAGSYVLPAGRWVLPEDWPLLATFAGFGANGNGSDFTPANVLAWDLNSGWAYNPGSERPVVCGTSSTLDAADVGATTVSNPLINPAVTETGAIGDYVGAGSASGGNLPCFGQDGNNQIYTTAPNSVAGVGSCAGGTTYAPFDATEACTVPYPLVYAPSGSVTATSATTAGGVTTFGLMPTGKNSTYFPNGTLNQWDAPMPPAQVSFAVTGGPGSLAQVNKSGLYYIHFTTPVSSSGSCTAPYVKNTSLSTPDCEIELFPDPPYTAAIPASPLIPPTNNNGGYLWNSWGFTFGTVTTVTAVAPFAAAGAPAGGFVPGESTGTPAARGGLSTTTLAPCAGGSGTTTVALTDLAGFMPGMTVEAYAVTAGAGQAPTNTTLLTGLQVAPGFVPTTGPGPLLLTCASVNAAFARAIAGHTVALGGAAPAVAAGTADFISEQFGLPVNNAASFTPGTGVTVVSPSGQTFSSNVALVDTAHGIVYITNAEGLATALSGANGTTCTSGLSRPVGASTCEPAPVAAVGGAAALPGLVAPGNVVSFGPGGGATGAAFGTPPQFAPPTPYPFWQWVGGAPAAGSAPTSATVYSDNHGEAIVALQTNVSVSAAPSATSACPSGYTSLTYQSTVLGCQLPYSSLSQFQNIKGVTSGCINTYTSGTTAAAPGATIGANGPAAGQICVNGQGGLEFGSGAVLGTTTVNAVADYPYTREHAPVGAPSLTKVWTSAFNKSVKVSAGTPGPADTTAYTVTVTANDICGNPITGEPIEVYALGNAGAAVLAPVVYGSLLSASTTSAVVTANAAAAGTATFSLEVLNSAVGNTGLVVKVVFPFEKIERFATVITGTTGTTATVVYPPGWQQVGGPAGSNFSVAEALFSWDPVGGAYTNATASAGNLSSAAPGCTGYWAYFAAAMSISLPATSTSGQTASCTLAKGWNLVGNPFGSAAKIQSGVSAFHWNGTSYDTVGIIPVGGSVWVYNDGTLNTVTLTAT